MTAQEITNLVTNVGFPILCVIFMWRKITISDEKQNEILQQLTIAIHDLSMYIRGDVK